MAYTTATIVSKDPATQDGRVHLVIAFTGDAGETPVQRDFTLDADSTFAGLRTFVRDTISALANRKAITGDVRIAIGQVIPAAAADPVPTQAELNQRAYFADVARLIHMQQLVSAGGMLASQKEFTDLQAAVKAAYLAAYATSF